MVRTVVKILVSSPLEEEFVKISAMELLPIADHFLITEANIDNFGNYHPSACSEFLHDLKDVNSKIQYIYMDLSQESIKSANTPEQLHKNEQIMRNGFTKYVDLLPNDLVVSLDADEILYARRVKVFQRRLNRRFMKRRGYVLKLHQFVFFCNNNWTNCNFRGPVITRASVFLNQSSPQWRYTGTPTIFKSGVHFSWVMPIESMVDKILSTSHSIEYRKYADVELLRSAIIKNIWIFDPLRDFRTRTLKSRRSRKFPKSLRSNFKEFNFTKIWK